METRMHLINRSKLYWCPGNRIADWSHAPQDTTNHLLQHGDTLELCAWLIELKHLPASRHVQLIYKLVEVSLLM